VTQKWVAKLWQMSRHSFSGNIYFFHHLLENSKKGHVVNSRATTESVCQQISMLIFEANFSRRYVVTPELAMTFARG